MKRIAFIGNYLPRQCGIATFTTDLCESISNQYPDTHCFAVAMNDRPEGYSYPPAVRFEVEDQNSDSYRHAAEFLNLSEVDLVCLQHEYGIFGGSAGSYVLDLLEELKMPLVTTLHTVLANPDPEQRRVLQDLCALSDRLVVMNRHGFELLLSQYRVAPEKVKLIPHGIPDVPFVDSPHYKTVVGLEGKYVLLTFGLLSPNKGVEHVIQALPEIVAKHPEVVYVILGSTHPNVVRQEGESYRSRLEKLAAELGVENYVVFINRFTSLHELTRYIGAADIYITPYLNREQSVSGTLAYTVGAGKVVISTPYRYAEELLGEERGVLVPFADSGAIAASVLELLNDEQKRDGIRKRAYEFGRKMIWKEVAHQYMACFASAKRSRRRGFRAVPATPALVQPMDGRLPAVNLDHLRSMTDTVGLLQHATYTVPNYEEGYTTDDNARALLVMILLEALEEYPPGSQGLISRYLAFLMFAFNSKTNRFRNFLSYDRKWLEEIGSEDSQGRAVWALGTLLGSVKQEGFRGLANRLFQSSLPYLSEFSSLRASAFAVLGLHEYWKQFQGHLMAQKLQKKLTEKLIRAYKNHPKDWPWFEESLTYCNAVLPHAVLLSAKTFLREDWKAIGLQSLTWLAELQHSSAGYFVPIGNDGFYPRKGKRARFDQQPVEAQAMVSAALAAHRVTGEERWKEEASKAFHWFLGENDLKASLYDASSGGCRDGLHPDRANENQGAESTLSFLQALLELKLARKTSAVRETQLELQSVRL